MRIKKALACIWIIAFCGCVTSPSERRRVAIEEKLDRIVIAEVDYKMANAACAWTYLLSEARRLDEHGRGISIVWIPSTKQPRPVNFAARGISLREALNLYCQTGGLRWWVEDSVVKITPEDTLDHDGHNVGAGK